MEIDQFPHPDRVWTWKSFARRQKVTLWIPYLQAFESLKGKGRWRAIYNGGEFEFSAEQLDCILLYGAAGHLSVEFLDDLNKQGVPLLIHRRNMGNPYLFLPTYGRDDADILSAQINARGNNIRRVYIAKTLIRERFRALEPSFLVSASLYQHLNSLRALNLVRQWEALQTRRYWQQYFTALDMPTATRRGEGDIKQALDACSFFLFGVILRWALLHRLSPCHGFLHEPTNYPSLIYDLMEPYRYILEHAVAKVVPTQPKDLTAASLAYLKDFVEGKVFVAETHQWVRRKNLLHGSVLALRAYLIGDMKRLLLPVEGVAKGGRPPKVSYKLAGSAKAND